MKTLEELQKEVGEWHRKTFGDNEKCSLKRIGRKLLEESAEAYNECAVGDDPPMIATECADVLIAVLAIYSRLGLSAQYYVAHKFEVVKARKYSGTDLNQG